MKGPASIGGEIMDAVVKLFILVLGMGMVLFFLGERAFQAEALTLPQPDNTASIQTDDNAYEEQMADLEINQKELDAQQETIDDQIAYVNAEKDAIESEWGNLEEKQKILDQETEELAKAREDLNASISEFELDKERIEQEQDELVVEQSRIEEERRSLDKITAILNEKEQMLDNEQDRLNVEYFRLQERLESVKLYENMLFYIIFFGLVLCAVALSVTLVYLHRNKTKIHSVAWFTRNGSGHRTEGKRGYKYPIKINLGNNGKHTNREVSRNSVIGPQISQRSILS